MIQLRIDIKDGAQPFNIMALMVVILGVVFIALYQFVLMPYLKKRVERETKITSQIHKVQKKEKHDIEHKENPSETTT